MALDCREIKEFTYLLITIVPSSITCADASISGVSWFTRTVEAADSVNADGIRTASSIIYFTLVDICIITDQYTHNDMTKLL